LTELSGKDLKAQPQISFIESVVQKFEHEAWQAVVILFSALRMPGRDREKALFALLAVLLGLEM